MRLSVLDRLVILNILPQEDNITTMRVVHDLRQQLSFTEAEHAALQFREVDRRMAWQPIPDADIEIGPKAKAIIRGRLEQLNREKKLTSDHIGVWDKFECVEE